MKSSFVRSPSGSRNGALLVLLALNLFLACAIAAYLAYNRTGPDRRFDLTPAAKLERVAAELGSQDAAIVRAEFARVSADIDRAAVAFDEARERVAVTLLAEPYDLGATRQAMAGASEAKQQLDKLLQEVIASSAGKMSADGRLRLANWPRLHRVLERASTHYEPVAKK